MQGIATPGRPSGRSFLFPFLSLILVATLAVPAGAQEKRGALDRAAFDAGALARVAWNAERDVPTFLAGDLRRADGRRAEDAATAFFAENAAVFGLAAPADDFEVTATETDRLGLTHVRVQQVVGGVPVFGGESALHFDRAGALYAFGGDVHPGAEAVDTRATVSDAAAVAAAQRVLGPGVVYRSENVTKDDVFGHEAPDWAPEARLVVYPWEGTYLLAWHVTLYVDAPHPANWEVFVDAHTGQVVHRYNSIHTFDPRLDAVTAEAHANAASGAPYAPAAGPTVGSGTSTFGGTLTLDTYLSGSLYYLYDTTRGPSYLRTMTANNGTSLPGSYITDSDNSFTSTTQKAGVDAHYGAAATFDYFKDTHGRNSYDGNNASITSTVHYSSSYNNAFWNGSQMVYGDGDGSTFIALVSLDIVAHELTHAVTERSAGLIYEKEPGALNEAVSDIFAIMVDRDDWLLGELSYTPGTSGDALRYIDDPPDGGQPDHYDDRLYPGSCTPTQYNDYCGVHSNSGIVNKAAYLMIQGGTHGGVTVTGIGRDKVEDLWYRALTTYFTSTTNFASARSGCLQAAADLYGSSSAEYATVEDAWAAVGVGEPGGGGGGSDTYEPNGGFASAYGPLDSGTTYSSYIWSSSDDDYFTFTTAATGTIEVTLANFPGDYDVFLYNSAQTEIGRGYTVNDPETITVSNAAAGTYYVRVDGYNGASSQTDDYELTVTYPTSGGGGTPQWYYESVTYDTPHNYPNYYDASHFYTKAGAQQVAMYFSTFNTETNYDFVYIKDGNGTTQATYHGNLSPFWAVVNGATIEANLVSDYSVTRYGYTITQVAYYATSPLLVGEEAMGTPLAEAPRALASPPVATAAAKVEDLALLGARPNPFAGGTQIAFALPEAADVTLRVYDVLGREVAVLVDGWVEAGEHAARFEGAALAAGTYLYTLETGGQRLTGRMLLTR